MQDVTGPIRTLLQPDKRQVTSGRPSALFGPPINVHNINVLDFRIEQVGKPGQYENLITAGTMKYQIRNNTFLPMTVRSAFDDVAELYLVYVKEEEIEEESFGWSVGKIPQLEETTIPPQGNLTVEHDFRDEGGTLDTPRARSVCESDGENLEIDFNQIIEYESLLYSGEYDEGGTKMTVSTEDPCVQD